MISCKQAKCDSPAAFRYTWPGENESHACAVCALKLRNVAGAIGLPLQLIQLTASDYLAGADTP